MSWLKAFSDNSCAEVPAGVGFLNFLVGSDVMLRVKRRESLYIQESGWYRGICFVPFIGDGAFLCCKVPGALEPV